MANNNINNNLDKFFKLFKFKFDRNKKRNVKSVSKHVPSKSSGNSSTSNNRIGYIAKKFDSTTQRLFELWKQLKISPEEIRERINLYQEMDNLYMNSALISRAVNIIADEIVQADENTRVISVESQNPKIKEEIEKFLDDVFDNNILRSTAYNIVLYGDGFWFLSFGKNGVNELLEVDPYDVYDRIEFTPVQISEYISSQSNNAIFNAMTNDFKLKMLIDKVYSKELEDYSSFFKSYLFGFQVGEYIIPPWNCLHFRNYTTNELFYPFGVPMFLHSLFPYKQYEMALAFQSLLRQAKFPIDKYEIAVPNSSNVSDALEFINDFMHQFDSSGLKDSKKEDIAIGERIFTVKDLFTFEQISSQFDIGRIDDIELLKDDIVLSTGLPRNLLDPNNGSFGNSGISLIEQFKPFARLCYKYQSIILNQINTLCKIHLLLTDKFSYDDINFTLSMPFPESQTNPEIIQSQSEKFRLANDILDALKTRLMGDEAEGNLPVEVIRDVFETVLPYDQETTNRWIDAIQKENERLISQKEQDSSEENIENSEGMDFTFENIIRKNKSSYKIALKEEVDKKLKSYYGNEYKENRRHYYRSNSKNIDFDPKTITSLKIEQMKLLENEDFIKYDISREKLEERKRVNVYKKNIGKKISMFENIETIENEKEKREKEELDNLINSEIIIDKE